MLTDTQLHAAYNEGLISDVPHAVTGGRRPTHGEAARLNALRAVQAAVLTGASTESARFDAVCAPESRPKPPLTISLDTLAAVLDGAFDLGKTSVLVHSGRRTWQFRRNSINVIPGAVFSAADVLSWRTASATDDPRLTVDSSNAKFATGKHLTFVSFTIVDGHERATFTKAGKAQYSR